VSITIPPHEYRHIAIAFCPHAIQQYSATFEASVEGGEADPATAGFVCELRGAGTLPSLSIQEPSAVDGAGRPLLRFGRLLVGGSLQLPLIARNHGLMAASARIEMEPHPVFKLLENSQVSACASMAGQRNARLMLDLRRMI
jgi:hydrocephalus-inducing protein